MKFIVVTGAALATPFLFVVLMLSRSHPAPPPKVEPFEDHWPALKKEDRLPVVVVTPTPTLVMQQEPELDQGQVIITKPELPRIVHHERSHYNEVSDVCTRHHMHKVTIGRSWRCRK